MLDERILPIQLRYDKALELAGLKHVRSAPSARARPSIEVQPGGWSGKQDFAGQNEPVSAEPNEVDKLRAEMQEMKKMIMEQAELIKSLLAKQ